MSSDGRYMYHHPQAPPPMAYEHPSYPTPPYESAQYTQNTHNAPRPMRPNSSHSHSSQQSSPYQPPPTSYAPPYGSTQYIVYQQPPPPPPPPQNAPQWTGEGWAHYGHSYPPPPPVQDTASFNPGPGRPELTQGSPVDQRSYAAPASVTNETRRVEDRPLRPSGSSPPKVSPRIEPPAQIPPPPPRPPTSGLDFEKLLESYRLIMDTSNIKLTTEPPQSQPYADGLESMLQAATFGLRSLEAVSQPTGLPNPRPVSERSPKTEKEPASVSASPANAKLRKDLPAPEGQVCLGCNATQTPEWRRGPMGPRTLCNACGLVYAKLIKRRYKDASRSGRRGKSSDQGGSRGPDEDSSGDEDDESYGSQGRQSEVGDNTERA